MKRSFLDITGDLFRQTRKFVLEPFNLQDETYYIYKLDGYRIPSVLSEVEGADIASRSVLNVNTQRIKYGDYIIEQIGNTVFLKITKSNLGYELSETDRVELSAQLKK
jgi:hypothetical protein